MVTVGNFYCEPALQLPESKYGMRLGGVILAHSCIAERGARKDMDGPHHRADEPFNMASVSLSTTITSTTV
jgi:hypothetical protein